MSITEQVMSKEPVNMDLSGVTKGLADGVALAAAEQKSEQIKMQIEEAKLKEGAMKTGIFIDYMDKIANSPNPAIRSALIKQYGIQHQKMYGQEMDPETLKALSSTPDFKSAIQALGDQYGISGMSKGYLDAMTQLAQSLGLPYVDSVKMIEKSFQMMADEKKAQLAADAAKQRISITGESLGLRQDKAVQEALKQAEEDKQVQDYQTQILGADKGLTLVEKGLNRFKETKGKETITYGQLAEIQTDLAALQAVKPSAVVPIGREKKLEQDQGRLGALLAQWKTDLENSPQKLVPVDNLKLLKEQLDTIRSVMEESYAGELKKGYSRGVASGLLSKDLVESRSNELLNAVKRKEMVQAQKQMTTRDMIKSGMSLEEVNKKRALGRMAPITQAQYDLAKGQ